jgi:hypothetical protein
MKSLILLILAVLGFQTAMAQQISSIPEVGGHYPLFTFEKNENPQNILVLYTKLDNNCHVVEEAHLPVFDMYWLMDRLKYKPTNSMIKSGIKDRLQVVPTEAAAGFYILINDLKEVNSDLRDPRLTVIAEKQQSRCKVRSLFTLGPSDKSATMQLISIYSEATKTLVPPFRKLKSVTLNGINAVTGAKISRTYFAK